MTTKEALKATVILFVLVTMLVLFAIFIAEVTAMNFVFGITLFVVIVTVASFLTFKYLG